MKPKVKRTRKRERRTKRRAERLEMAKQSVADFNVVTADTLAVIPKANEEQRGALPNN